MKFFLLISHGSQSPETKEEVVTLVRRLKERITFGIIEYAFLDIESPSIPEAIDLCAERGASQIVLLLNFLNSGQHVDEDIPRIVESARQKYPRIKFTITKPVGQHRSITDLFCDMIE